MDKFEPHITEIKKNEVEDIKKLSKEYKVLGIINVENLPAFNYMKIRRQLSDKLVLKYTKKRLMKIAFDETGDKNLQKIKDRLVGIPVLLFTNEDPFRLFQELKKSKTPALANPGDIAPRDIIISAGPTEFTPGPMIGELGSMGIKTMVEGGKISIREDKLLVKEGEVINEKQAALMGKLNILPMEIGLNLVLTYGNGEILERSVLDIDVEMYENNLRFAVQEVFSLALSIGFVTEETANVLIKKAENEARSVRDKSNFLASDIVRHEVSPQEPVEEIKEIPIVNETREKIKETPIIEEIKKKIEETPVEVKKSPVVENKFTEVKSESKETNDEKIKGQYDVTNDDIMLAQKKLKELTNKKIRGEL